jgi:hypothetical protein
VIEEVITKWENARDAVDDYETKMLESKSKIEDSFLEAVDYAIEINVDFNEKGLAFLEK